MKRITNTTNTIQNVHSCLIIVTDFVDNFYDGSQFNVQRNIPFKFLSKLPVSKLSSKRFLNQSTNKIV